jgi:hypothetical protein
MLNILIKKNFFNKTKLVNKPQMKKNDKIESNFDQYKNTIYYTSSGKEWFTNNYSYNKPSNKLLITKYMILQNLFKNYFNMFENKIKILFKRRRSNKKHSSANKIYLSRGEIKHTNTEVNTVLHTYNKQNSLLERYMRKFVLETIFEKHLIEDKKNLLKIPKNRLNYTLNKFFQIRKWNNILVEKTDDMLKILELNVKKLRFKYKKIYIHNRLEKIYRFRELFFNTVNLIKFNKLKFNNLFFNLFDLGLKSLIEKIYEKTANTKLIELKSIHLNSDVFSSAVAIKLKNRQNKAVRVLRKAVLQMVKIPDLHTLITFYDGTKDITKNTILHLIKQQVVSGIRFEAKGRLTRRLTAMRSIFKYRYTGSLKNVFSSFSGRSTTMLRGHVKSNLEYIIVDSKTRNGSFGLKVWISSH